MDLVKKYDAADWQADRMRLEPGEYVRLSDLTSGGAVEVDGVTMRLYRVSEAGRKLFEEHTRTWRDVIPWEELADQTREHWNKEAEKRTIGAKP